MDQEQELVSNIRHFIRQWFQINYWILRLIILSSIQSEDAEIIQVTAAVIGQEAAAVFKKILAKINANVYRINSDITALTTNPNTDTNWLPSELPVEEWEKQIETIICGANAIREYHYLLSGLFDQVSQLTDPYHVFQNVKKRISEAISDINATMQEWEEYAEKVKK